MSLDDPKSLPPEYDDHDHDDGDCWQCGGEGGWNSCMEDTCCAPGGEEGCTDRLCWRVCDICKGGA